MLLKNISNLLLKSCHKVGRLKTTTTRTAITTKPSLYLQVDAKIFSLSQLFQVEDSRGIIKAINLVCLAEVTLEKLQKRLGDLSRKKNDKGRNRSFGVVMCILYEISLYLGKWEKKKLKK